MIRLTEAEYQREIARAFAMGRAWQLGRLAREFCRAGMATIGEALRVRGTEIAAEHNFDLDELYAPPEAL